VLETHAIDGALVDLNGVEAVAFTSRAAVAAFAALSPERELPVFAVGESTAAFARQTGFLQVGPIGLGGDVQALADRIATHAPRPGLVLTPTAKEPAADLTALLARCGIAARSVAVYETTRTGLTAAPADIDGVLIHSAKAGQAVAALVSPEQARTLTAYAISDAAAADLHKRGFARILIADHPDEASLLKRIEA
jgi:uroporphyrinogen-III synthase